MSISKLSNDTPSAPSREAQWADCTRSLGPAHRSVVKGHLLRLEGRSRSGRFWCDASVAHIESYTATLDLEGTAVILGCFPDQSMRALVEMRPMDQKALAWEAVLSVETAWQDKGVGMWLLEEAIRQAKARGAERIYFKSEAENTVAKRMAIRLGATLSEVDGDALGKLDLRQLTAGGHAGSWVRRVAARTSTAPSEQQN
jgi:GNAT superfamily N-acetyltransferase